jgi:hypothetical protein
MWTGEGGKLAYTYLVRLHPLMGHLLAWDVHEPSCAQHIPSQHQLVLVAVAPGV